jgi:hypothetical protein
VKAYTSALRVEAEMDDLPVAITLVRPSAVDTPSVDHARSHLAEPPRNIPPIYTPELVARVVLHCAVHARRDVTVGSGRRVLGALERIAPRVTDKMMVRTVRKLQKPNGRSVEDDSLFLAPLIEGQTRGMRPVPHVHGRSLSTSVSLRPFASGVALAAVVLAIGGAIFARR